jgi:hypothetical protein
VGVARDGPEDAAAVKWARGDAAREGVPREGVAAVKAWLLYAGVSAGVTLSGALFATLLLQGAARSAVWFAAGLAWVLQLASFGALVAVRRRNELFLLGWLAGLVLRFGAVGAMAFWLSRSGVLPLAPALVSLVVFVFILLMLEPLFLRRGLQTQCYPGSCLCCAPPRQAVRSTFPK